MKLEIDLTSLDNGIGIKAGRCAAIALLSALPRDEAWLAVNQWRKLVQIEDEEDQAAAAAHADEFVGSIDAGETPAMVEVVGMDDHGAWITKDDLPKEGLSTPVHTTAEASTPAHTAKPSYEKFTYGDRTFSTHKRGP